jgi:protein required for attachment to host cells
MQELEILNQNYHLIAKAITYIDTHFKDQPSIDEIAKNIQRGVSRGKTSSIIIVAEGKTPGLSYEIQRELEEKHLLK